jgi:ATP phosphoribosyltransferase
MNVRQTKLKDLLKKLPALREPTISGLADKEWVAVETVIDEKLVRKIIPDLKEAGAEGIIEYSLNKLIQ